MSTIKTIKVILVGDGASGKTTFLKKHRTGEFDRRYNATLGVEVHPIKFYTNNGPIIFYVWDVAGQEKFGGLRDGYFIQGQAAIVMFDHRSKLTLKNTDNWSRGVKKVCGNIPMVLCGNKKDLPDGYSPTQNQQQQYLNYHSVSAKKNGGYELPFLTLLKHFLGENTVFTTEPE